MDKPASPLARAWTTKALSDLETARQIGGLPEGHLDAGIYHCQQAAEKVLKAFLVFHDQSPDRIHDLGKIIEQAIRIDPTLNNMWNQRRC